MRNLKKILALVLALVMSMSLLATANAFNDDAEIDPTYDEAVTVLANLGVFQGYNNGETFVPKGSITRAEVAAILYRIATGDVDDTQVGIYADYNKFSDVKSTSWYAGYVNYCANAEYIKGYDDKTFGPNDPVTGYQALAMILRAVGYDANGEFTGNGWQVQVASYANQLGLTRNVSAGTLNTAATREVVAEVLFRTIAEAYVVKYTAALGYQPVYLATSSNKPGSLVLFDGVNFGATLGGQTFGLARTTGEITGVSREAGITRITDFDARTIATVSVTNTPADWTDIGYQAYVYTVPTAGAKTLDAVSDLVVTGESIAVNTDGKTVDALTSATSTVRVATLDTNYRVYYNGMLLDSQQGTATTTANGGYWFNRTTMYLCHNSDLVYAANGLKVDFVDNDDGGLAEAIVFTEYTAGRVAGITNESNAGSNAYLPNYYYLDAWSKVANADPTATTRASFKAEDVISADTLAVGDVITYVVYDNEAYVTKTPYTTGTFTQINYGVVAPTGTLSYLIGGTTYFLANNDAINSGYIQDYFGGYENLLQQTAVGKTLAVYTDPYGYVIYVTEVLPEANYLFVIRNEDTDVIPGTTQTSVVTPDGAVSTINVARVVDANGHSEWNFDRNTMPKHIYNNNANVLTYACDKDSTWTGNYTKGTSYLEDGAYLTTTSVVVDIRGVLRNTATAGTVYTGRDNVPSLNNVVMHYVADQNGFITLAYITDGITPDSKEFVVYHTQANSYGVDSNNNPIYTLSVIENGALTTITLTDKQYADIVDTGVGIYEFGRDGKLVEYTSFDEDLQSVVWNNNTIVIDGKSYSSTDAKFWVLDIDANKAEGAAYGYSMISGSDTKAYVVRGTTSATEIYIIKDVTDAGAGSAATYTKSETINGVKGTWTYVKQAGDVTEATWNPDTKYTVTLLNASGNAEWNQIVNAGDKITLPKSAAAGAQPEYVKVTVGTAVSYVAAGTQYTVTGNTILELDYYQYSINGEAKYYVKGAATHVAAETVTDELKLAAPNGNFYLWKYSDDTAPTTIKYAFGSSADTNAAEYVIPGKFANQDVETGFYKIDLKTNLGRRTAKVSVGVVYDSVGKAYNVGDTLTAAVYYAKAGAQVAVYDGSDFDGYHTVVNNDITIPA